MLAYRRRSSQYGLPGSPAKPSVDELLSSEDYKEFSHNGFEATDYANRVIQAPADSPFHGMDIATALAKLSFGIEHLNKHIHEQVTSHYEDLLHQVTGLSHVEEVLGIVKQGVASLNSSFDRVREKILEPSQEMRQKALQLQRIQHAAEILRRVIRFTYLSRRLQEQLSRGEPELPKSALSVNELDSFLQDEDLEGLDTIEAERANIKQYKEQITIDGQQLLERGMATQNQTDMAAGLQVLHNIGQLGSRVRSMLDHMLRGITKAMQKALDVQALNRELKADENARRAGTVGDSANSQSNRLWKRLEALMDAVHDTAIKVYQLQRVLTRRRDAVTHILLMDEVTKGLGAELLDYFWNGVSGTFERELRLATKGNYYHAPSQSILHMLENGYPRLLRLVHNVFTRISVVSGVDYSDEAQRPDSLLILRTLSPFETAYLSRSLSRLLEPINATFPERLTLIVRPMPSRDDIDKIVRTLSSEMEAVKFDVHLLKAVIKNGHKALTMYAIKCRQLCIIDSTTQQIAGTGTATQAQLFIVETINCVWWLQESLWRLLNEFQETLVDEALNNTVDEIAKALRDVVEPLFGQVTRELESTIMKIHREDFTNRGRPPSRGGSESTSSQYVVELAGKIRWLHRELFSKLQCGEDSREWVRSLGQRTVDFFLRHASLVRPMNEGVGRLLASDMTQIEFVLSQWFAAMGMKLERDLGGSYHALRAFRHLPFLDLDQIVSLQENQKLSPVIVLHHVSSRADPKIPVPMMLYAWTEAQYSEWLDMHSIAEAVEVLSQCFDSYGDEMRRRGEQGKVCKEFVAGEKIIEGWKAAQQEKEKVGGS